MKKTGFESQMENDEVSISKNKTQYEEPDFDDEVLDKSLDELSKKSDKIKKATPVVENLENLIDEHEELVSIIRNGGRQELLKLADEQENELFEYQKRLKDSYGKKRIQMPQIDEEVLDEYLIHHAQNGLVKKIKCKLSDLKPTQKEIDEDKILEKIQEFSTNYQDRKYIISNDDYILDGHHDWAHGLEEEPDFEVTCYRINLPIGELLRRSNLMKISKNRDLYENISKSILYDTLFKGVEDELSQMKNDFLKEYSKIGIVYSNVSKFLESNDKDLANKENCMNFYNFLKK